MSAEEKVKTTAAKLLAYITKLSLERKTELSDKCTSRINQLYATEWKDAKAAVAPYLILSNEMRYYYIKTELSFLSDTEAANVKQYLDFIAHYAGSV